MGEGKRGYEKQWTVHKLLTQEQQGKRMLSNYGHENLHGQACLGVSFPHPTCLHHNHRHFLLPPHPGDGPGQRNTKHTL